MATTTTTSPADLTIALAQQAFADASSAFNAHDGDLRAAAKRAALTFRKAVREAKAGDLAKAEALIASGSRRWAWAVL